MKQRRQRRLSRSNDRLALGVGVLTFLICITLAGGCGSSSETESGRAEPKRERNWRTYAKPTAWRVVLPKPYKYIDIAGTKFGVNTIFVRSEEEAEKYRQQGAYVEPVYQDTYGGMRIP